MDKLLVADEEVSSSKRLPTSRPLARKGLFFGMSPLVPLDMLHTPEPLAAVFARQGLGLLLPVLAVLVGSAGRGWGLD